MKRGVKKTLGIDDSGSIVGNPNLKPSRHYISVAGIQINPNDEDMLLLNILENNLQLANSDKKCKMFMQQRRLITDPLIDSKRLTLTGEKLEAMDPSKREDFFYVSKRIFQSMADTIINSEGCRYHVLVIPPQVVAFVIADDLKRTGLKWNMFVESLQAALSQFTSAESGRQHWLDQKLKSISVAELISFFEELKSVLVDGSFGFVNSCAAYTYRRCEPTFSRIQSFKNGDSYIGQISAASILATYVRLIIVQRLGFGYLVSREFTDQNIDFFDLKTYKAVDTMPKVSRTKKINLIRPKTLLSTLHPPHGDLITRLYAHKMKMQYFKAKDTFRRAFQYSFRPKMAQVITDEQTKESKVVNEAEAKGVEVIYVDKVLNQLQQKLTNELSEKFLELGVFQ